MKVLKNNYFYFVVLFSGWSTSFFRSNEGIIVLFIVGIFIFGNTFQRIPKSLLIALGIWMGYFALITIAVRSFHPMFMLTYIVYIIIAWWLVSFYREKIFVKYENAIYILSVISLFFYTWQVIHFDSLYQLISFFDLSQNMSPDRGYASIIVYSIRSDMMDMVIPRNSGFTWEPGPFSSFIALAIFFNLLRNKLLLKDKRRLIVFLIAIASTQSTTGITMLLIIAAWLLFYKFKNIYMRILIIPLTITLFFLIFFNVPILQEKISSESEQDVDILIENSLKYDRSYRPGRFASFTLAWRDFKNYPFLGIGGNSIRQNNHQLGAQVETISGIGMILVRYGLVGTIIFLFLLIRTGKWLAKFYAFQGYFIFPLLILSISFAFKIIETPLLVTLWISSIFLKEPIYYKNQRIIKYVKENIVFPRFTSSRG